MSRMLVYYTHVHVHMHTRIHGNEDSTSGVQLDLPSLKDEVLCLLSQGLQDGEDLLGHH